MACPDRLSQWTQEVSTAFARVSKPQRWGLALWRAGIALAGAAGLAQVSALLSAVLLEPEATVFQRLREWYLDKEQKSGKKRRELEVATCFGPLLRWVVRLIQVMPGEKCRLALALDATSLRTRWTIHLSPVPRATNPSTGCHQSAHSVDDPGRKSVSGRMCDSGRVR